MKKIMKVLKEVKTDVRQILKQGVDKLTAFKTAVLVLLLSAPVNVYAADANASWNTVMNFLIEWVPKLGAVLLFYGAVEFGIAYKSEDANSKTNATRTMVAGAMVIAIPTALKSLLLA